MTSMIDFLSVSENYIAVNLFTAETGFGVFVVDGKIVTASLTDEDYCGLYLAAEEYGSPFSALMDDASIAAYRLATEQAAEDMRDYRAMTYGNDDPGFDEDLDFGLSAEVLKRQIRARLANPIDTGGYAHLEAVFHEVQWWIRREDHLATAAY